MYIIIWYYTSICLYYTSQALRGPIWCYLDTTDLFTSSLFHSLLPVILNLTHVIMVLHKELLYMSIQYVIQGHMHRYYCNSNS